MSDEQKPDLSILLPQAGVALFSRHADTREVAMTLEDDWRFARITLSVEEGDVETAAAAYQLQNSPRIVIVETDKIDDSFLARLEHLASSCSEGTNAVVIGPVNDVYLYRKLVGMGVSDYLVRPLKPQVLSDVVARILITQMGADGSHLVAVVGGKGGVGVSTLAEGMALGLAEKHGQKTAILDAAGGWSYLSVGLGSEPSATLSEATRASANQDDAGLNRMLLKATERLSVLGTGLDTLLDDAVDAASFEIILSRLMTTFPYVIADLSQSTGLVKRMTLARAHEIILVSQPTLSSLRTARTLLHEIKGLRGGSDAEVSFVLNMVGIAGAGEVSKSDIQIALERKPDLFIPFDPKLFISAESETKHLTDIKGGNEVIADLLGLLKKSVPIEIKHEATKSDKGGFFSSLLGKAKGR